MIVLDASALVDLVIDQPWRDQILDHLDQPILAPAHQLAEVLSALARLCRADELRHADARDALAQATSLGQTFAAADGRHLARALELRGRLRVLDALYVALAEEQDCPLLTSDRSLAASDPPCAIILVPPLRP